MVEIKRQLVDVLLLGFEFLFLYFELELVLVVGDGEGEAGELVFEGESDRGLSLGGLF